MPAGRFCHLEKWTQYVDVNWQNERDRINAAMEKQQAAKATGCAASKPTPH